MAVCFESCAALAALLLAIGYWYVRRQYSYWQRRGIPFAAPTFPFGNFGDNFLQRASSSEVAQRLYESSPDAPVLGVWSLLKPMLLINDPELVRAVCIKDFGKFADRGVYHDADRDPLSAHLFAIEGERWRRLRGKLSPTFTSGKLKAMFSTLVDSSGSLRQAIHQAADTGSVLEMRELVAQYMTNVIASAAFGLDIDAIADPQTPFRKYGRKVFEPSAMNALRGVLSGFFPKAFKLLRLRAMDADCEEFFMSVVRQNMEYRERNGVERKDFFQLLLQLRNGGVQEDGEWQAGRKDAKAPDASLLSMDECAAQSFVFFAAGFETSSTTVSFALYELAKNVDIQRRLQREIDEVLARHNGEITYESVSDMKYLDWCFDETLRKYPVVILLNRQCSDDWQIPNTNMIVERGTSVLIPARPLQMDPKYYPDPERFWPERFDPEHEAFRPNRPYLPFGDGPRNCIGARFGKMQSKVGLIVMLRENSYELAGNTKLPLKFSPKSILLAPVGGIELSVTRRVGVERTE